MGTVEFKAFFDGASASAEQLDRIDEIVVDQAVDRAWEARLKIPVCVDESGAWRGDDEAWARPFATIRVEVNAGDGSFVPLIDGPVVGFDSDRSALPGRSVVTLIVHDEGALLNREASVSVRQGQTDSDIARELFQRVLQGAPEIDNTPPQPDQTASAVLRGTPMQCLRDLARRNRNWHAYVLPGSRPGASVGCFKKFATETDGLPDMVLLGLGRNVETFNVNNQAQNPATYQAATVSIAHDQVQTSTSTFRDATLMGDDPPDTGSAPSTMLLPPGQTDRTDLDTATGGAAGESGYSLEATGAVVPFCYNAALSPYRVVMVRISNSKYSGKYLITQVTHTLTRSLYTQSFAMKGNATTGGAGASAGDPQASALTSVGFNAQVSIF